MLRSQRVFETGHLIYGRVARREKNQKNKDILLQIAAFEQEHADI